MGSSETADPYNVILSGAKSEGLSTLQVANLIFPLPPLGTGRWRNEVLTEGLSKCVVVILSVAEESQGKI